MKDAVPIEGIPESYRLSSYDYPLPESHIAQFPIEPRDRARLLVLERKTGRIEHRTFSDLPQYLTPSDLLVLNETRVIPARLVGRKLPGGGKTTVLFLRRTADPFCWEAFVRGPVAVGGRIRFGERFEASVRSDLGGGRKILGMDGETALEGLLEASGQAPLPPYIRREPEPEDRTRYQTVYAKRDGSVAAPTAGMHFTEKLLDRIRALGVAVVRLTLHVGRGTFQPVRSEDIRTHRMEREWYEIPPDTAEAIARTRARHGRIVAVGTTVTRVLESSGPLQPETNARSGWTDLYILPGHRFENVDALVTNFHYPKSTLIILVTALAGREVIRRAYAEAATRGYRFLSFGDAMLIL